MTESSHVLVRKTFLMRMLYLARCHIHRSAVKAVGINNELGLTFAMQMLVMYALRLRRVDGFNMPG